MQTQASAADRDRMKCPAFECLRRNTTLNINKHHCRRLCHVIVTNAVPNRYLRRALFVSPILLSMKICLSVCLFVCSFVCLFVCFTPCPVLAIVRQILSQSSSKVCSTESYLYVLSSSLLSSSRCIPVFSYSGLDSCCKRIQR